jgi:hypothetical protein
MIGEKKSASSHRKHRAVPARIDERTYGTERHRAELSTGVARHTASKRFSFVSLPYFA